jgi:hypothetical protein
LGLIQQSQESYNNNRSRHRPFLECRDPNYNRNDENGGSNAVVGHFGEEPPKNNHEAKEDDFVNSQQYRHKKKKMEEEEWPLQSPIVPPSRMMMTMTMRSLVIRNNRLEGSTWIPPWWVRSQQDHPTINTSGWEPFLFFW